MFNFRGQIMKRLLLAGVALSVATAASAADMQARPYSKAPPAAVVAAYNWSGFYIGAMGGYGWDSGNSSGGFGGGTIGYNWQMSNLVLGLEADVAGADISAGATIPGFASASAKIDALGTVRGRVGVAFDQVLLYGTGGYAWADTKVSASVLTLGVSDSKVLNGWTAGAGVEWMFAPRWSLKGEYLYRSFSSTTFASIPFGTLNINSGQVGVNYHF
jgi:outer membrane immunogenic protein